ncbi:M23 family metallopeptidase [Arthrobacter sp. NyZ413]|uniref:M23 family metallopeptidase n=1 Tax=Arthrobacter sp. NyZ413 TaxID=3144669 RepID=UPI003BF780E2
MAKAGLVVPVVGLLLAPVVLVAFLGGSGAPAAVAVSCSSPAAGVDASVAKVSDGVAGFGGVQLKNAAAVMGAAKALKLPVAAQVLGVQAAIGESSLRVIDYGDGAGPDSRGLFQQRANGAWGSYADRMDPTVSATNFFKALQKVPGWEALEPSEAIHRVQRNADPGHYTRFRGQAVQIVQGLSGADPGARACTGPGGAVTGELAGKWVNPLPGAVLTSGYGPRQAPAGTAGGVLAGFHYGIDFSTPGHPGTVLAVTDLKITIARDLDGMFGTRVDGTSMDGRFTVGFYHMAPGSLRVKAGDVVAAGTPLGTEGESGNVSGRHLHLEFFTGTPANPTVPVNPTVNPEPILRSKGALP